MPSKDKQKNDLENKVSVQTRMVDMLVAERNDLQKLYDAQQYAIHILSTIDSRKLSREIVDNLLTRL